jgi:hypothetical protein
MTARHISRDVTGRKENTELAVEALFIAALLPRAVQVDLLAWQMEDVPWQEIRDRLLAMLAAQQAESMRIAA